MRGIIRPELLRKNGAKFERQFLYPFLTTYRQTPEHEMLRNIAAAVPTEMHPDRRADICQELAVAILVGDIETKDLKTAWKEKFADVYKLHPTMYAPVSLDAPIGGEDGDMRTRLEMLSEDYNIWDR